jgi:hypothetical protein
MVWPCSRRNAGIEPRIAPTNGIPAKRVSPRRNAPVSESGRCSDQQHGPARHSHQRHSLASLFPGRALCLRGFFGDLSRQGPATARPRAQPDRTRRRSADAVSRFAPVHPVLWESRVPSGRGRSRADGTTHLDAILQSFAERADGDLARAFEAAHDCG